MRTDLKSLARVGAVVIAVGAAPLQAQLVNASAAATGLVGSYTALARNFNAAAWNPANLGLPGNSSFSLAILPLMGSLGTGPVTPSMLKDHDGVVIPDAVKREWIQQITAEGGQSVLGDAGVTFAALNIGRIGLHASTGVFANGTLSPATMEVLLFGNAGFNNGVPKAYALSGSTIDASVLTTVGLSYAQSLKLKLGPMPDQTFSVGATAKYILGNGLISGIESGGVLDDSPLEVRINFPMIASDDKSYTVGKGIGLDLGAAWQGGPLRAGLVVRNLINTFAWDETKFSYRPFVAVFTQDSTVSTFEEEALTNAPAALQDRLKTLKPDPTIALGLAYSGFGPLTVSGEFRQQMGDGLKLGPKTHMGVGAELRIIPFIPLRAGFASITGGTRMGAGFGLEFGLINLQLGVSKATIDGADEGAAGVTLSFGGR